MAKLDLTVQYKVKPAQHVFRVMCVLFPVWAIVIPALLGLCIGHVYTHPSSFPPALIVAVCLSLFSSIVASLIVTGISEDNRIHVSKDGITFPTFLLPWVQFRRNRSWDELTNADLITVDKGGKGQDMLMLGFNNGKSTFLKMSCCDPKDIEQLLVSVELWGTACQRTPQLVDYQRQVQNEAKGVKVGYTQMWEEELSRRFAATSFVPLEPDAVLQNGRLKVIKQLAFGGLSAIYLAQKNKIDMVVLKEAVVPPNADDEKKRAAEKLLEREAELLAKLNHPNIAHVLDNFVEDSRHYLVLEYINGQDLRQFIKQNGPVDQKRAVEWGLSVLDILGYLHRQDPPIVHRDLTPDNLVLTNDGTIVLIDFGAANQFVGAATGTIVGKQAYIPPEQLRGKTVPASDFYAFAGSMNFFLTGNDPLALSVCRPGDKVEGINPELNEIIAKCSAFEPQDRYHSAEEIATSLKLLYDSAYCRGDAMHRPGTSVEEVTQ